jgi:hypothetical protein
MAVRLCIEARFATRNEAGVSGKSGFKGVRVFITH